MRFSVFLTARSMSPADDQSVIEAMIAHAALAEDLGFDAVFSPDHHFTGYAPWASDPFMFAAFLAAKLKRVHFGFSVTTVPLHHPVRLAERINLLDQLTQGRLLVGIGSGTTPEESIGFGVKFQDASRVSQENLEIIRKLWGKRVEDEPIEFNTGTYKGAVVQRIAPAPYSKPHPRLMPVAFRGSSLNLAAENAWSAFIHAFTPPNPLTENPLVEFTAHFNNYLDAMKAAGHSEEKIADALSWTTRTYQVIHVAPSDEQAHEELQTIIANYKSAIEREHEFNKRAEGISGVNLRPHPNPFEPAWIKTWCLVGSPNTVSAELEHYRKLGVGNILGSFTHGPLKPERARLTNNSIQLYAREVIPRFKS